MSRGSTPPEPVAPVENEALPASLMNRPEAGRWLAAAFESSPMAVALRGCDLKLLWANEAYSDLIGKSVQTLAGREMSEVQAEIWDQQALATRDALAEDPGTPHVAEIAYDRPDGSQVHTRVVIHGLCDDTGKLRLMLSFIEDVSNDAALLHSEELDDLVADVSSQFVKLEPTEAHNAVESTLARLGAFFDATQVCVLEQDLPSGKLEQMVSWHNTDDFAPNESRQEILLEKLAAIDDPANNSAVLMVEDLSLAVAWVDRNDHTRQVLVLGARVDRTWNNRDVRAVSALCSLLAGLYARIEAQLYLSVAFEEAPVGISVRSTDSELLAANQAYADFLGYDSPTEMQGEMAKHVLEPHDHTTGITIPSYVDEHGTYIIERVSFIRKDGEAAVGRVHAKRVAGIHDEFLVLSHVEDITETTKNQEALRASERRFESLVENSPAVTFIANADLEITYASPSVRTIGLSRSALEGRQLADAVGPSSEQLTAELKKVLESGQASYFDWAPGGSEGDQWLRVSAMPEMNSTHEVTGVIMVAVDDSGRRRRQQTLLHEARHDSLTGLANRLALGEHIRDLLDQEQELTLLFLDVDRFKVINDSLGHSAGDELIKGIGERLRQSVRKSTLVARFGGDEFVIVIEGRLEEEVALKIGSRIKQNLAPPFRLGEHEVYTTVSIGIAFPTDDNIEDLISRADSAMYLAKDNGRNRTVLYDAEAERVPADRIRTEAELRKALPRCEFEPHFQAEVALETGALLGAEALVRWHHPTRGLLAAAAFIEIAEECGLITEISSWVLAEACKVLRRWQSDSRTAHLSMRVNLSARQLSEHNVVDRIKDVLNEVGVDPRGLCLEITETAVMADAAASLDVLEKLRALGVTLAIDDFGTGYSSLSYLKRFPVDVLKVDRSFVDGLPADQDDKAIVDTIIRVAQAFDLELVAEGVERQDQADLLLAMGCSRAQGYFFGRPMEVSEFEASALFAKTRDSAAVNSPSA